MNEDERGGPVGDDRPGCGDVAGDLAELALGISTGEARARLLGHLERCDRCAAELARLAEVADRLVLDRPVEDPPAGFESRVLAAIRGGSPRARRAGRRRVALVAAAAAVALVAGFGVGWTTRPAAPRAPLAAAAAEPGLRVAVLAGAGRATGTVYAYGDARSGWLLMSVRGVGAGGEVTCAVTTRSGRRVVLGAFWPAGGAGSWTARLPVAASALAGASVLGAGGAVLASATFTR